MIDLDADPPYPRWECASCDKGIAYTDAPRNVQDWDWATTAYGEVRLCLECLDKLQ